MERIRGNDIRDELERLIGDVQRQIDNLNNQLKELTDTDRQIVIRIQQLSRALMQYSDRAKQLLHQKMELETETKRKEKERQKEPMPEPNIKVAQKHFEQEHLNKSDKEKQNTKTFEQNNITETKEQERNSISTIEQMNKSERTKETLQQSDSSKTDKELSGSANTNEQNERNETIESISDRTIALLGPKANAINYILKQRESINTDYGIKLLQQKQIEQELKYIREQIKLIRSELYMLKEILDTLIAKERILLSERNQLYKIASDTRQKLLQLDKETKDTDSLLSEIKQKVEELNRKTNLSVFEQKDTNNESTVKSDNTKQRNKDKQDEQEQESIDISALVNSDTIGQELLEQDPFEYAKRFTKRVNTLDTDALETDNTDSIT